jgi:hypothetical protein
MVSLRRACHVRVPHDFSIVRRRAFGEINVPAGPTVSLRIPSRAIFGI